MLRFMDFGLVYGKGVFFYQNITEALTFATIYKLL